jgi:formylglycine-generating enzyme required for sulfatase activity
MNSVSWYHAAAYCNWLSMRERLPEDQWCYGPNEKEDYAEGMKVMSNLGKRTGYRLPTEAEWECSCRAGAVTAYSFGEPWVLLEKHGWFNKNSPNGTQPVGTLKPNDLGLFDLHGNLWEWCQDRYNPGREYTEINIYSYTLDETSRPLRGGTFLNRPTFVRSANRVGVAPSVRGTNVGFRPSRTFL